MHIFLEGADCAGKSTFAYALTSALEYSYLHRGPLPHDWDQNDYLDWIARVPTVFDRLLLSETVYGERMRRPLSLSDRAQRRMIRILGACGIQVVITAQADTLRRRYSPERELFTLDEILEDNAQFFQISKRDEWRPLQTIYLASEFIMEHTDLAVEKVTEFMTDTHRRRTNGHLARTV